MTGINPDMLAAQIRKGERRALAKAITLVESTKSEHQALAQELLTRLLDATGHAVRLGLSGAPGVGKSTFIEAFGNFLIDRGHKVAVLAVDPSSRRSGGSILGDKTRMETLSRASNAFIRPSPSGGSLGGVARRTREAMLLAEAAGFDVILVETVGVGQSETAVADMVDMFLLLLSPGGGDELQGIKRGIMELADLVIVNKADGDLAKAAKRASAEYRAALHLIRPKSPYWTAQVLLASALTGMGLEEIWDKITAYGEAMRASGHQAVQRAQQAKSWMWTEIEGRLRESFRGHPAVAGALAGLEDAVAKGEMPPGAAAERLLTLFQGNCTA